MSNERPHFVMSMFANKEALLEAKCEWLENRVEELERDFANAEVMHKEALKVAETSTGRDDW